MTSSAWGAVGGLEVDDRHLASVQAANKVDAAVDGDARRDVDLDLLSENSVLAISLPWCR